ncbi:CRISPR system precrRNA processing endoribonuclease RAMP protein Cas6 [Geomonas sp. RF6]|uniref:CRISPR system precrRNA processing endoribonuclease RAMP protein Cas6 n=1 Tax=Geomonas sp. RF6 TaxID=2897342 RepID=UPI001E30D5AA|nr:CRISPR system precrRNA processing endoribonuclease RAMP protein Cas6 [Geomonas sp. RF6]UFS68611.1 CRISPR system precrRNA processing endoribonuclease RAMP protein Cas6 [Geomonas sp. RF6]
MELHHVTIIFTATLTANLPDPFALFSVRGAFEESFREAVGCRRGACPGCLRTGSCAFAANFAQELSRDPEGLRRHQKPPLPFVFRMPVLPPLPNRGKSLECSLTLFGSAIQHFDNYLGAAALLFRRVGAHLSAVELLSPGGERSPLPAGTSAADSPLPLLTAADPLSAGPLAPDRVTVDFLTPLRLPSEGKVLRQIDFSHFARALLRRVSTVAYYYGGIELPLDYRALAAASEKVTCTSSTTRFTQWGKTSGIVGTLSFCGDIEEFHLLLLLGRAMHLGKGASFGLGHFQIS